MWESTYHALELVEYGMTGDQPPSPPSIKPPYISRQRGSKLTWPPDESNNDLYIRLEPKELRYTLLKTLDRDIPTILDIAILFKDAENAVERDREGSKAYYNKWKEEIDSIIERHTQNTLR